MRKLLFCVALAFLFGCFANQVALAQKVKVRTLEQVNVIFFDE
jgi:hypothetical protein